MCGLLKFRRAFKALCKLVPALTLIVGCKGGALASDPLVNISVSQLDFGTQVAGTVGTPKVVVISAIGPADTTINSITISGQNNTDFTQTSTCPIAPRVLAANARCEVNIIFQPKETGELSAAITIDDNAPGSPQSVSLKGIATAAAPSVGITPGNLTFDPQIVGTSSAARVVVLSNNGSVALNITTAIRVDGVSMDEFHLKKVENSCPLDAGQVAPKTNCKIGIVFSPLTVGEKAAQVIIEDDAPGSPHAFALNAVSIAADTSQK
jgi:hypothetical protein